METKKLKFFDADKTSLILSTIKKIKFGAVLLVFLLLVTSVFASPPPIPDKFTGIVTINGNDAPIGTGIEVYVNGELEGETSTTMAGEYELYVTTGDSGDEIILKILNQVAGTSVREGGKTETLNLAVNIDDTEAEDTDDSSSNDDQDSSGGSSSSRRSSDDDWAPDYVPFDTSEDSSGTKKTDSVVIVQNVYNTESNEEESNALWNMLTGAVVGDSGRVKTSVLFSIVSLGLLAVVLAGLMYLKSRKKK